MPRNEGSAPAFGAAIARARDLGTDYVWLLDDDNLPEDASATPAAPASPAADDTESTPADDAEPTPAPAADTDSAPAAQ